MPVPFKKLPYADFVPVVFSYTTRIVIQGGYFILIARILGPVQFGAFSSLIALINIFSPFIGWGSGNLLVMHVSTDKKLYPVYMASSLIIISISFLLFTPLFLILSKSFLYSNISVYSLFALAVSELLAYRILDVVAQVYQANNNLKRVSALIFINGMSRIISIVIFYVVFNNLDNKLEYWLFTYAAVSFSTAIYLLLISLNGNDRLTFDKSILKYCLKNGLFYSLGISATNVYTDADKIIISRLGSDEMTGVYSVASRVVAMLYTPIQALVFAMNRELFIQGSVGVVGILPTLKKFTPVAIIYGIFCVVAVHIFAPFVLILIGSGFSDSIEILKMLAPVTILQSLNYLYGDALMGAGKQRGRSMLQILIAMVSTALSFILIGKFALRGAVITVYIGQLTLLGGYMFIIYNEVKRNRV